MAQEEKDFFDDTYNLLTSYVDDRILLLRIRAAERSGKLAAIIIKMVVTALFLFFIILFGSFTLGYYFSQLCESTVAGFGILTAVYLGLFLLFLLINKQFISKSVINTVIRVFFEKTSGENGIELEDDE